MVLKNLATSWAQALARKTGETDQYKIALARYMLESLLSTFLSLLCILLFGLIFGVLKTALLLTLVMSALKAVMGGLHLKTPLRCALVGAVMTIILSYLALSFPYLQMPKAVQWGIFGLLVYIVWKKAPREAKGKPLTAPQKRGLARNSRVLILLVAFICWCWPEGAVTNELFYGTAFQVLNLTVPMAKVIDGLDRLFDHGVNKFHSFTEFIGKGG
ncbi:MAG TPA: accessory gene regulator B family protein [Firmicutes bacterium]|uniref:Accessory gene regulator B family protein n=1 Tax=Capillibacterium thermochitinicola TaxID=2699427 RepID=A0A8J6I1A8_9FIRM|nr:accessory gene regulator B family protein [Capillibacterium thermochitinicola]HHW11746.1 accessory gene regulator B family protein [Bacillota bacterium]